MTDLATGLMWKRCSEGRSGANCAAGANSSGPWNQALTLANNAMHAGFTDWRLPNADELLSLVESGCYSQSINSVAFPGTGTFYWSSTTYTLDGMGAWYVDFTGGNLTIQFKGHDAHTRLVRGGQSLDIFDSGELMFSNGFEALGI